MCTSVAGQVCLVAGLACVLLAGCAGDGVAQSARPGDGVGANDGGVGAAVDASPNGATSTEWDCEHASDAGARTSKPFASRIACVQDFLALAAEPSDFSISGARTVKTVIDRDYGDELYFQNTQSYSIHWLFASEWLSAEHGLSLVSSLGEFNQSEYYLPSRRFLLGSLTHYESSGTWVYELAPYDTADATLIEAAFERVRDHFFLPDALYFHPTSEAQVARAAELDGRVPSVSSDALLAGMNYVPHSLGESYGLVRVGDPAELSPPLTEREILVTERLPVSLPPLLGVVTQQLQPPLAEVTQHGFSRGTPNLTVRDALRRFAEFDGKWVRLNANANALELQEVSEQEAAQWWQRRDVLPAVADVAAPTPELESSEPSQLLPTSTDFSSEQLRELTAGYGSAVAHFAALSRLEGVVVPDAVAVPAHHYERLLQDSGLAEQLTVWAGDEEFVRDAEARQQQLAAFAEQLRNAEFSPGLEAELSAALAVWDGAGAALLPSTTLGAWAAVADPSHSVVYLPDANSSVADAVKSLWAAQWSFAAFEARRELGLDPFTFALGVLVQRVDADAGASGVALTNNPFDMSGMEPCYYVNVQSGQPPLSTAGAEVDQFLIYYGNPNQPASYLHLAGRKGAEAEASPVLSASQSLALARALAAVEGGFAPLYRPELGADPWWAMRVGFRIIEGEGAPVVELSSALPVVRR
jgi:pyruvate, water dikinase